MSQPQLTFGDLAGFCAALERDGIGAVVVRRIHEIRPRSLEKHQVEVGPQRWTELAAYRDGTLYTARLAEPEADQIEQELSRRGLQLRLVTGNLG